MALNERTAACFSAASSGPLSAGKSVTIKDSIVARWGNIIPAPLAMPRIVKVLPAAEKDFPMHFG